MRIVNMVVRLFFSGIAWLDWIVIRHTAYRVIGNSHYKRVDIVEWTIVFVLQAQTLHDAFESVASAGDKRNETYLIQRSSYRQGRYHVT